MLHIFHSQFYDKKYPEKYEEFFNRAEITPLTIGMN